MKIINCLPITISVGYPGDPAKSYAPSGHVADCVATHTAADEAGFMRLEYGNLSGLPDPEAGTVYIVSQIVAAALRGVRDDVCIPAVFHPLAKCMRTEWSVPGLIRNPMIIDGEKTVIVSRKDVGGTPPDLA